MENVDRSWGMTLKPSAEKENPGGEQVLLKAATIDMLPQMQQCRILTKPPWTVLTLLSRIEFVSSANSIFHNIGSDGNLQMGFQLC